MEEVNVSPTGISEQYNYFNSSLATNPIIFVIISIIFIGFILVSSSLGEGWGATSKMKIIKDGNTTSGINILEVIMWSFFLILIITNGVQYFFGTEITAKLRDIFTDTPKVDIAVSQQKEDDIVPEIKIAKQVFHIPGNEYTYDDAKALCKAYGSDLASLDQIESSHRSGSEWCSYGWSKDQMALYPTQKKTYNELQKIPGHEHDCGRPGINGGFIGNPNVKFGANCYGYKPEITPKEVEIMNTTSVYPKTQKELDFEEKVKEWKTKIPDILVAPFNHNMWSKI